MDKEWKFEPDPITRAYINYLDTAPIKFDNLNRQIELIRKSELTYNRLMVKENSKLKELADYIMGCNTLEEVMKGIAIGISSSIYDNDIQKEALDYLEKNRTTTFEIELPEGMTEEEASKILVKAKNDKSFQKELKLEKVQN